MTARHDLLFEIGTEELPPRTLAGMAAALGEALRRGLEKSRLGFDEVRVHATARRLAVHVERLAAVQPDVIEERRGPALTAAFDADGKPTQAALGFARSCGVDIDALESLETDKGAWLVARAHHQGRDVRQLLPAIVADALTALPIARRMRWGALESAFVRPVHWLVLLYGDEVVPCELFGLSAGRETRGHRFHHPGKLYLASPAAYVPLLESEGHVIVDIVQRREAVRAQVIEAAASVGAIADIDESLLDEVAAIIEWPSAVTGRFDEAFLDLPDEVLISVMRLHQKYFHLRDAQGRLLPYFITISNIESRDPQVVRAGNERVIRPRLSDAMFFWKQDRRHRLDKRIDSLRQVVYQRKLGTLFQKTERLAIVAAMIAAELGGRPSLAERAGWLAKCDLMSDMVGEFPELQGIMGGYYAAHDGEDSEVVDAIAGQYQPRSAGDDLPATKTAQALAIADRLDTLVGTFGLGLVPSGDKDPFALRRAALGMLRIMIERGTSLDLPPLVDAAMAAYQRQGIQLPEARGLGDRLYDFMMERLRSYYQDAGIRSDVFDAVMSRRVSCPADFDARVRAVRMFQDLPEAESLAAANKRIANILKKSAAESGGGLDHSLLHEPAEQQLAKALDERIAMIAPLVAAADYAGVLKALAVLRPAVDAFFDQVLVMSEDPAVQRNRLALLQRLHDQFMQVADLACLSGQAESRH